MQSETELIVVIPLILVLVLAGGCMYDSRGNRTPGPAGTIDQPQDTGYFASNPVSLYITYPDFDGGVDAGAVTVTVIVRNFSVVDRIGEQNKQGEGHIVYFKDVPPQTITGLSVAAQPGTFQISALTSCTWYNVSPDTHTFVVELVNNDNTPLSPPVIDAVDVTAVLTQKNS
ncbi:MAG: hypothetical protein WC294_09420 [Methanoregula sp.]|jgi:hypothetical protein